MGPVKNLSNESCQQSHESTRVRITIDLLKVLDEKRFGGS